MPIGLPGHDVTAEATVVAPRDDQALARSSCPEYEQRGSGSGGAGLWHSAQEG